MQNSYECYYIIELLVGLLCGVTVNNLFLVEQFELSFKDSVTVS